MTKKNKKSSSNLVPIDDEPIGRIVELPKSDKENIQETMNRIRSMYANLGMVTNQYDSHKKQIESDLEAAGIAQMTILDSIRKRLGLPENAKFKLDTMEFIVE